MPGWLKIKAKGRRVRREPGVMNGLEKKYAAYLDQRKSAGEILDWKFDEITVKLAEFKCRLTVDFWILMADRTIEAHDVKGHWEDDARVKIKVAADRHWWFTFVAVKAQAKKNGGGWDFERFE
jgi:hypothetical protein